MNKTIFLTGIVLGAMAVILGAFGAHGLEKLVDADAIQTFETGVRYQMYHALLLLVLGNMQALPEASKKLVFYFVLVGIFCFSFSIYLLAMNSLTDFDFRVIGLVTPLGGTLLIVGWGLFGYRVYKYLR
ncbi:DUF423 domain-containing protein [Zobellia galactanivorans]|uniref:DUF423 domain-containing protein n=1 Tax=Zobellia galactanivorans (strain DSM 12802 / CCUG 47099 / CIP 106680 / NCIMB 13871 / Dsij) TaxID=63186 RepID=UPI001C075F37|nr:DUF423 domain-containing protein [Zobellia galactanivorans]MBU3028153.1 DUF423 domain-containing protein [Zobellia galactanivorans]MDO6808434.1 DUF423 domain-containing protein [Zobellia galactanivorans]